MGKIWALASGSGGVGKSTVALALAAGASKAGYKTILLDASGMARSCDLVLGLESIVILDMMDVLHEQTSMDSALYPVTRYENLLFACASLYDDVPASELASIVLALNTLCDVLVIDLPTGQIHLGQDILRETDTQIVVVRPDEASIRAAERLISGISSDSCMRPAISLVVNRMSKEKIRQNIHYPYDAVQGMLDCTASGCIPEDSSIPVCEKQGRAAIECDGPAWNAFEALVRSLL